MHTHNCRYCIEKITCALPRDECFLNWITCTDCFRKYELKWVIGVFLLLLIAGFLTVYFFKLIYG